MKVEVKGFKSLWLFQLTGPPRYEVVCLHIGSGLSGYNLALNSNSCALTNGHAMERYEITVNVDCYCDISRILFPCQWRQFV